MDRALGGDGTAGGLDWRCCYGWNGGRVDVPVYIVTPNHNLWVDDDDGPSLAAHTDSSSTNFYSPFGTVDFSFRPPALSLSSSFARAAGGPLARSSFFSSSAA